MNRIPCLECRQCNHKGKPSVTRFSKYCDNHYKFREKPKKSLFGWLTNIKDKFAERRTQYNDDGSIKDMNTKGFRRSWFWR